MKPGFLEILNQRGVKYIHFLPLYGSDNCILLKPITPRQYWNAVDARIILQVAQQSGYNLRRHSDTLRLSRPGIQWPAPDYNVAAHLRREDRGLCIVRVTVPANRKDEIIEMAREMRREMV